jgi:Leucine-rich repeat (LRR) protein
MSLSHEVIERYNQAGKKRVVLNLWGEGLLSISALEVSDLTPRLSSVCLSQNSLTTLKSLLRATKLTELFARNNEICELSEINVLRELGHLRHLWLSGNPCAEADVSLYQLLVLQMVCVCVCVFLYTPHAHSQPLTLHLSHSAHNSKR